MSNSSIPVRSAALTVGTLLALTVPVGTLEAQASPAEQRAAAQRLQAHLKPSGDPDGSGEAHFTLNKGKRRVCATVEWHNIAAPDAAHIHRRSDGGIVVDLTGSVTGGANCKTGVSKKQIGRILGNPGRYYFNVHNGAHPAGAIQGRLRD